MTEMKGCPQLSASEATLPPLGALEGWERGEEREEGGKEAKGEQRKEIK